MAGGAPAFGTRRAIREDRHGHAMPSSAGGRSGPAILCRKGVGRPGRLRPGLERRCRTARWPSGWRTGPPPAQSGARHRSGTDRWCGSDPKGSGRGCASTRGPEPEAGPRTAGSIRPRPERPVRQRRTGLRGRKTLPHQRMNGKAGVHRRRAEVRIEEGTADQPARRRWWVPIAALAEGRQQHGEPPRGPDEGCQNQRVRPQWFPNRPP